MRDIARLQLQTTMFLDPKEIDPECLDLCVAMNKIPGIITFECCSGHGKDTFRVFFRVDGRTDPELRGLYFLALCADSRYWKYGHKWSITLTASDSHYNGIMPNCFCLESQDKGQDVYDQAQDLICSMDWNINSPGWIKTFDLHNFGIMSANRMPDGKWLYSFIERCDDYYKTLHAEGLGHSS